MDDNTFSRVTKTRRCPVCGRHDWCLITGPDNDPEAAICARTESEKRCGEAGWLHRLRESDDWTRQSRRTISVRTTPLVTSVDFNSLAKDCQAAARPGDLHQFASGLGVTPESLGRLSVGWSQEHRAWSFPMRDAAGNVVGIRLRLSSGRKLSIRGGREGLFIPEGIDPGAQLLIAEGPTDTAALLDLGFNAIGRPSCMGGMRHVIASVERHHIKDVVVVADGDEPGQRGATNLASTLAAYVPEVRVLDMPAGVKDARDWKRQGATHEVVSAAIEQARSWSVRVNVRRGGRAHV